MREISQRSHLRLVSSRKPNGEVPPSATSIVTIEIYRSVLRRVEVKVSKEDAIQALHGLAMAHMRALDLLTH